MDSYLKTISISLRRLKILIWHVHIKVQLILYFINIWYFSKFLAADKKDHPTLSPYSALISARGLLYSNTHPAPRKFQALFKPQINQVMKNCESNRKTGAFLSCQIKDEYGRYPIRLTVSNPTKIYAEFRNTPVCTKNS